MVTLKKQNEDNSSQTIKLKDKVEVGKFLHTIIYDGNGKEIIVKSHRIKQDDQKDYRVNVGRPTFNSMDSKEISKLLDFVEERKKEYKKELLTALNFSANANIAIEEYLGSIVIIDTSDKSNKITAIKDHYPPVQLGINYKPEFRGRNFSKDYKVSKEFAGELSTSIPASFTAKLNYNSADLFHVKMEIKNIGAVIFPATEKTPIQLLIELDEKQPDEQITKAIAKTLSECNTCILTQITTVLAHEGIFATKDDYNKSDFAMNNTAGSVVTTSGTFRMENSAVQNDFIYPMLLSIGITGQDLKNRFQESMLEKFRKKKLEIVEQLSNANKLKNIANLKLKEVNQVLLYLEDKDLASK